jgi:hypothetical protein
VFEKHGVDSTPLRKRVCEGTEMAVDKEFRRRLACVGASFFGYPMMSVNEENFLFMTEAWDTFVSAFLDIVEQRKDATYTDEDIAKQDAMRLNWFEDQMFADPYAASGITPYEPVLAPRIYCCHRRRPGCSYDFVGCRWRKRFKPAGSVRFRRGEKCPLRQPAGLRADARSAWLVVAFRSHRSGRL